jgi:hypothetical protein
MYKSDTCFWMVVLHQFKKAGRLLNATRFLFEKNILTPYYSPSDQESSILESAGDTLI